jgi:hypothetical protein
MLTATKLDQPMADFRVPSNFFDDIFSVAAVLKIYFRELPDPLLTREQYHEFVDAANIEEDAVRRDTLHANINNLPDSNYATLRALVLHLNRVIAKAQVNRMNANTLSRTFAYVNKPLGFFIMNFAND